MLSGHRALPLQLVPVSRVVLLALQSVLDMDLLRHHHGANSSNSMQVREETPPPPPPLQEAVACHSSFR